MKPYETERTIKQSRNLYLTVYNMEVVLLLAFRLNSYQARAIRKELMERIERDLNIPAISTAAQLSNSP